jgi:N-acetylmuramoyl-L-alanine amidase
MTMVLDPGHGGFDTGTICDGVREKDITQRIVREMLDLSRHLKHDVIVTRVGDEYVSLERRVKIANSQDAEVLCSIHCNTHSNLYGTASKKSCGQEVWVFQGSKDSRQIAERVGQALRNLGPGPWRGIREAEQLYVLKHARMPAVLVNIGFIDSAHDRPFLTDPVWQRQAAQVLFQALQDSAQVPATDGKPAEPYTGRYSQSHAPEPQSEPPSPQSPEEARR